MGGGGGGFYFHKALSLKKKKGRLRFGPRGLKCQAEDGTHRGVLAAITGTGAGRWSQGPPNAPFLPRMDSLPSGPGAETRGTLSPSLRCSAASLVSWESEMKHCSSGREKLFCGRQPGSGKWWWCSWALGNMGAFPLSTWSDASAEEIPGLKACPCRPVLRDSGQVLTPLGPALCPAVK